MGGEDPRGRKWQPTPVFLPGKSHGQRSVAGYSPWSHKESDTTKRLNTHTEICNVHFSARPTELSFIFPCFLWKYKSFSGRERKRERKEGRRKEGREEEGRKGGREKIFGLTQPQYFSFPDAFFSPCSPDSRFFHSSSIYSTGIYWAIPCSSHSLISLSLTH